MDRDPLIDVIAEMLSDAAKLVMVLGVIPIAFLLAGPAAKAVMAVLP